MKEEELYTIGEVAGIYDVSARALCYYDKIGLFSPDRISEENGYRYYNRKTLLLAPVMKYYKQVGFRLEEVQEILGGNTYQFPQQSFHSKISGFRDVKKEIQGSLATTKDWYELVKEAELVTHHRIQDAPVRLIDPVSYYYVSQDFSYQHMEPIINIGWTNYLEAAGQKITGPAILDSSSAAHKMSGICTGIRIMQRAVWANPEDPAQIIRDGRMTMCAYHMSGYGDMGQAYEKILKQADTRGYACDQGCFERYMIDYWTTCSSSEFVTEVVVPVTSRSG